MIKPRTALLLLTVAFGCGWITGVVWFERRWYPIPELYAWLHEKQPACLEREGDIYLADELAGHLHRPNTTREFDWPEHPDGRIRMTTNNLGFRDNEDTPMRPPEGVLRILVTGDSHIDGVVHNAETFPNRLEALLNARGEGVAYEVINGGTGHYGPHNYLGFLRRYLDLTPDTYVVVVFAGNDFSGALHVAESRGRVHVPVRSRDYYDRLARAAERDSGAVWQGLNQALLFTRYPDQLTKAVEVTTGELLEVHRLCESEGIELVVMLLPTRFDVQRDPDPETTALLEEVLGLGWNDVGVNRDAARLLLDALERAGVQVIDLLVSMRESEEPLFWEKDDHLNVAGHERLAQILFDWVEARGSGE